MRLTPERKAEIDAMGYEELLEGNRFAPIGAPEWQGETGEYRLKRMAKLKRLDPEGAVAVSKKIGWEG